MVIKLPRSRESTPVAVTPPSTTRACNPRPSGRGPHTVAGSREATGTALYAVSVPGTIVWRRECSEEFR